MDYDPKANLRHHPTSMARFGQNPYGENLYRIVFAPSRRFLVVGERARWWPKYPECGDTWVMERWYSPMEYHGTREAWDEMCSNLGPYPERGEYDICHHFEFTGPDDCNLDKLISWIEEGRKRNPQENTNALKDAAAKEENDMRNARLDIIGNALPAFGSAPMVGHGGGRGTKTMPVLRSAQEAGLPTFSANRRGQLSRSKFGVNPNQPANP